MGGTRAALGRRLELVKLQRQRACKQSHDGSWRFFYDLECATKNAIAFGVSGEAASGGTQRALEESGPSTSSAPRANEDPVPTVYRPYCASGGCFQAYVCTACRLFGNT